jgi:xylulokinase
VVGEVTAGAARQTGLRAGTPVVAGCMDTVGAAVGSGILAPGESFIIMGTVARVAAVLDSPPADDRFLNCCYVTPDTWLAIAVMNGAGSSLRWFRDVCGQMEVAVARETGADPYDLLTAEAARSSPGAGGLLYLPYIAAERSPLWDPYVRGVFFGLSLSHRRGDLVRAMLEGVALSLRHNLEIMETDLKMRVEDLRIGGGGARSPLWCQVIADVLQKKLVSLRAQETETLGAAVLAGVGSGIYASFAEARDCTLVREREWPPDPEIARFYAELLSLYKGLYGDLHKRFVEMARLVEGNKGSTGQ